MGLKTTEQLREEICEEFIWTEDNNKDDIDKVLELKKDRYTATQRQKKAKQELDGMTKGKEFYKTQAKKADKTGKKPEPKGKTSISTEDKAYLYSKGYSRTELRYLEKVMKGTDKGWEKALQDNLFITFKKNNDGVIQRRGSQLGASRGGFQTNETNEAEDKKMADKFSQNLPKGFNVKKS